jgi:hypothetical protein
LIESGSAAGGASAFAAGLTVSSLFSITLEAGAGLGSVVGCIDLVANPLSSPFTFDAIFCFAA